MDDPLDHVASDGSWVDRRTIVDPEIYELERRRIFELGWVAVAHESQIPEPGDFVASWMGEDPVLVTRVRGGRVEVVLNSCSHRASRICRVDEGRASSWTCPNHGWVFGADGRLLGVPHMAQGYGVDLGRNDLGLRRARTEIRHGLVFASFGEPVGIDEHLGDASFYLESIFGRYDDGMELLGGALRSSVNCNWKLAMENLGTDLQHPEFAHAAFMDLWPDRVMDFMSGSEQVVTGSGHPVCIGRRRPPTAEIESVFPAGPDAADRREVEEWFERSNRRACDRLGEERANLYVFAGSVFPNLSFMPGAAALFLVHPRGPVRTEWWSMCLVPASAPTAVRRAMRQRFMLFCGPGGVVLAEDAENWADMTRRCASGAGDRLPLRVDRGCGEEWTDDRLPGVFAPMRSEHAQRGFWRNWRRSMVLR